MGQIIIEIPQAVNRTYRIASKDSAEKILADLEQILKKEEAAEDEDILGLWTEPEKLARKKAV